MEFTALVGNLFDEFFQGLTRSDGAGLFTALVGLDACVGFEGIQFLRFNAGQGDVLGLGMVFVAQASKWGRLMPWRFFV